MARHNNSIEGIADQGESAKSAFNHRELRLAFDSQQEAGIK
jgi:hypothetical protein